jgi:hypothetical protein
MLTEPLGPTQQDWFLCDGLFPIVPRVFWVTDSSAMIVDGMTFIARALSSWSPCRYKRRSG